MAMGIDVLHVDVQLHCRTAKPFRAGRLSGLTEMNLAVAELHLSVVNAATRRRHTPRFLEAERLRKELKRGRRVLIKQIRNDGLHNAADYFERAQPHRPIH